MAEAAPEGQALIDGLLNHEEVAVIGRPGFGGPVEAGVWKSRDFLVAAHDPAVPLIASRAVAVLVDVAEGVYGDQVASRAVVVRNGSQGFVPPVDPEPDEAIAAGEGAGGVAHVCPLRRYDVPELPTVGALAPCVEPLEARWILRVTPKLEQDCRPPHNPTIHVRTIARLVAKPTPHPGGTKSSHALSITLIASEKNGA